MYYYVLDENSVIINSIVLDGETDPALFGAVADERIFNIGDTWVAPPDPVTQVQLAVAELAEAMAASNTENQLAIAELAELMTAGEVRA